MLAAFHILGKKKILWKLQPHCNEIAMLISGLWPCVSANIHCQSNPAMRDCLRNTKFRSKRQETLMVPMLLWQAGLQPPTTSVLCLGKSPRREKPLRTDLCWARKLPAGQQAGNVAAWYKRRRPVWRSNNYFNSLLSSLDKYVISHLRKSNKVPSVLNSSACTPLIPALWKPNCGLEFTLVPVQWSLKTT